MGYYDTIKAPYDSKSMVRAVFLFTQLHLLNGIYDIGYLTVLFQIQIFRKLEPMFV